MGPRCCSVDGTPRADVGTALLFKYVYVFVRLVMHVRCICASMCACVRVRGRTTTRCAVINLPNGKLNHYLEATSKLR